MAFLDLLRLTVSLLVITAFLCLMYAPAHTLYNAKSFPALCLSAVSSSPPSSPPPPPGAAVSGLSVRLLHHLRHHLRHLHHQRAAVSGLSLSACCIIFATIFAPPPPGWAGRCLVSLSVCCIAFALCIPDRIYQAAPKGRGQGEQIRAEGRVSREF